MRSSARFVFALLVIVSAVLIPAFAQTGGGQLRSRDIEIAYDEGRADGLRVSIQKIVDGEPMPVLLTEEFKTGDRIRVKFQNNFGGFVYIVTVAPSGKTCLRFPHPKDRKNEVVARENYFFPRKPFLFEFTKDTGNDILQVYASRQPIPLFDDLLKNTTDQSLNDICLDESAKSAARDLTRGAIEDSSASSQSSESKDRPPALVQNGIRARGVELYLGEENSNKEATIAVEKENGDGHLKNRDIMFYVIHLKHK